MFKVLITALLFFSFICQNSISQQDNTVVLRGYVCDSINRPIAFANIAVLETKTGTTSNDSGFFAIKVPSGKKVSLVVTYIGYNTETRLISVSEFKTKPLRIALKPDIRLLDEVQVIGAERIGGMEKISMRDFNQLPNPGGNVEAIVMTYAGVASRSELSSQYSVRGGNFDENLVYVNDIEIMRPFLMRSGQQEGLSFSNSQMISSLRFSAGGFEARYGDKMSSVLDITYRTPEKFAVNTSMSLLGGALTCEGITNNKKFSQITGVRYKTSKYLLNTFETTGEYNPEFIDIQTLLGYKLSSKLEFSFLGNLAQNKYEFKPQTRSTNFGTFQEVYNLTMYYDGREIDKYLSATGALTAAYRPKSNLLLKMIVSGYSAREKETFDLDAQYLINQLDNTPGSEAYSDSSLNIGIAGMLNHARNFLWVDALTFSHIGIYELPNHTIRWGVQLKKEQISDRLNEWTLFDSSGFVSPYHADRIEVSEYVNGENEIDALRYSGYIQDTYQLYFAHGNVFLNGGLRINYWDYNKELLVSPRFRFSYQPDNNKNLLFYLAFGSYSQPAVYREMRNFQGELNPNIKAQKSLHFVVGNDYYMQLWDRPFKLTSEIYYKKLDNLIPYKLENVRIKYTGENSADGYAAGMDMKLNGEFIPGLESWLSVSLLKTEENIKNDFYYDKSGVIHYPGYYGRPTDQRFTVNLFFQDFLPNNPTWQIHLNLVYGSAVPVSPTRSKRFDLTFPMGPYKRVDIGLSKILIRRENKLIKDFIVGLEVFNLLNINNKASYLWVRTVSNQDNVVSEFAVPNYLTTRRLNLKLTMKF